jgi:hypothetical protein
MKNFRKINMTFGLPLSQPLSLPFSLAFGVITLLASTGCTSTTPNLDQHFGQGVGLIKVQQILNPQAARNDDPVIGIDGKAAKSAYDEYQKSYRVPVPPANSFTIGIGGR